MNKVSNYNFQITNNFQYSMTKILKNMYLHNINAFGNWNLEFGYYCYFFLSFIFLFIYLFI